MSGSAQTHPPPVYRRRPPPTHTQTALTLMFTLTTPLLRPFGRFLTSFGLFFVFRQDALAQGLFGKSTWDELDTDEKRKASGHGGSAHRVGLSVEQWLADHGHGSAASPRKKK